MSTVIFQFEYNYPYHRNEPESKYVIDACVDSVKDYAELQDYEYVFETQRHSMSPDHYYDLTCEWIYWLKDLAEKHDHIIVIDTDVYVTEWNAAFPVDKGYLCYSSERDNLFLNGNELSKTHSKMFANSGIVSLDKQTAIRLYNWFIENRNDNYKMLVDGDIHKGDQVHILKYLMEHPKDFNPTLPLEFHWSPHREIPQPNPVFCHLCVPQAEKYDVLCTILQNYT